MLRIKELRQQRQMTQEELGRAINVQKSAISKYEHSKIFPPIEILMKLSAVFNVPIDYIVGNSEPKENPFELTSNETQLVNVYRSLSPDDRGTVFNLANRLSRSEQESSAVAIQA